MKRLQLARVLSVVLAACGASSSSNSEESATGTVRGDTQAGAIAASTGMTRTGSADGAGAAGKAPSGSATSAGASSKPQLGSGGVGAAANSGGAGAAAAAGAAAVAGQSGGAGTAGTAARGGAPASAGSDGSSGGGDSVDASALAKAMGFGANIGNTLENTTTWETGWGQPLISKAFIDGMASHGIKNVRVPVAWDTYAADGVIDAAKLARVQEVVSWIEGAGMYAIVNIHWDGGWIFNENKPDAFKLTAEVKTKFASYWKQISSGFSQVGHKLILEGLNEEGRFFVNGDSNGTPDIAALNELNQLFVTTVREQEGFNKTRALLIASFNTDITKTCVDAFSAPSDPAGPGKLLLSIHFYDPYPFTLMEDPADWGSPTNTWGTDEEKKALEDQFSKLGTFSTNKQLPVILGEFAVTRGMKVVRQPAARILWMKSVAMATLSRGMVPVLWDTGSDISRSDGTPSSELQSVLADLE